MNFSLPCTCFHPLCVCCLPQSFRIFYHHNVFSTLEKREDRRELTRKKIEERTGERREKEVQLTVIIRNLNEQLRVCEGYETAPTGDWTQDLQFTRLTLYHWAIEALMQKGTLEDCRHIQFQPLFLPCQCMQGFLEGWGSKGKQRRSKGREKSNERRRKETSERERERDTDTTTLSDFREIQGYERAKPNRLHLMPWIDSCGIWTHAACASGTWVHPLRPLGQTVL